MKLIHSKSLDEKQKGQNVQERNVHQQLHIQAIYYLNPTLRGWQNGTQYWQSSEALFLDVSMECHDPQTGVKINVQTPVLYIDIYIFERYIYLYTKRESKHLFRLLFVGHGIPWIRPKIGPQAFFYGPVEKLISPLELCCSGRGLNPGFWREMGKC